MTAPSETGGCAITGIGSYVPERILTNEDLVKMVETTDEWITSRTGIKQRRIAAENEHTSDLAARAATKALAYAGVPAAEVDLIIVATITPDMPFPAAACLVQEKIGATRAAAFDLEAACTGFLYGIEVGRQFVNAGVYRNVLVIGAEKLSAIVDWQDRNTCVLFGDGAGAVLLQRRNGSRGILGCKLGSDGSKAHILSMPGGGSRQPASVQSVSSRAHYLQMEGKEVFKNAVVAMGTAAKEVLSNCGLDITQIKCIIPHQANRRIIDAIGERLGATPGQVFINLEKYGNTSAASVGIALDEAVAAGRVQRGDKLLFVAFGAGLTWGAMVVEW
ncbi:MAG: ketoacyl-ACP synthase III [Pedosphaera sp.]|nr:ketoacyl-ACP synthase III [Pedosphaera sp.]